MVEDTKNKFISSPNPLLGTLTEDIVEENTDKTINKLLDPKYNLLEVPVVRNIKELTKKFGAEIIERELYDDIKSKPIPAHVAIIGDGNRRYARRIGIDVRVGHLLGALQSSIVSISLYALGVKEVTFYGFSTENFNRNKEEVQFLMKLFTFALLFLTFMPIIHQKKIRVQIIGEIDRLPSYLQRALSLVESVTAGYTDHFLTLCLAYGSRDQLVKTIKVIARKVKEGLLKIDNINERKIWEILYRGKHLNSEPDLIIRTSGEARLSNFLLWESAYSELYFIDLMFPEFDKIELYRAIRSFQNRNRRLGR